MFLLAIAAAYLLVAGAVTWLVVRHTAGVQPLWRRSAIRSFTASVCFTPSLMAVGASEGGPLILPVPAWVVATGANSIWRGETWKLGYAPILVVWAILFVFMWARARRA